MAISELIFFAVFSYLIGSIPFAYILPKIFGFGDIRKIGSGNVGSTNVLRTGSKSLAIIVLFFDISKGCLPFLFLKIYFSINQIIFWDLSTNTIIFFISSLAILGHLFPIWLKFKGGKGVATYIGFLLAANYLLCFIFIFCWLIVVFISKYSSLSSIISLMIIPFVAIYLYPFFSSINNYMLIFISIIIILKHYSNILRLFNKKENKISF